VPVHDGGVTDRDTEWRWVAEQRRALAGSLDTLAPEAWDGPSLCGDWRIRDVVGHLVNLAEGTRASVFVDVARQLRPPSDAISRIAKREGRSAPDDLVARLRASADGRFVVPTQRPVAALGEVVVHGVDALRPSGGTEPPVDAERTQAIAETYRRLGPVFGMGRAVRRVRFDATDAGWSVGPIAGPAATGMATDVLLALAGRAEGRSALSGPGAELLRR